MANRCMRGATAMSWHWAIRRGSRMPSRRWPAGIDPAPLPGQMAGRTGIGSNGDSAPGSGAYMSKVMAGVRVLEVAQFTFVPAAGGILADWGADVIKIEHPLRGDTQRGFLNMGGVELDPLRHTLIEHPNRGKRSVGLDVSTPEGQEVLYELARTADVFLTNYLPQVRQKNKIDVEHIRAVNPAIIYARGSAW